MWGPMCTTEFIIFIQPGSRREPLGVYSGRGASSSDREADAVRQCRGELGGNGITMTAVPLEICDTEEAHQARRRRTP